MEQSILNQIEQELIIFDQIRYAQSNFEKSKDILLIPTEEQNLTLEETITINRARTTFNNILVPKEIFQLSDRKDIRKFIPNDIRKIDHLIIDLSTEEKIFLTLVRKIMEKMYPGEL
jgi:hypothetical protein